MAAFPVPSTGVVPSDHLVLRTAVSAYLGRYRGDTRLHTESDLRVFLRWCTDQDLDPLAAVRVDIERYLRWLQDVRRYQPSTVSSAIGGGRLLPRLRDRSDPAALACRLRPPAHGAAGVAHPGSWPSAVRSPDHHSPAVDQPQRLRPGRAPRLLGLRIFEACGAGIGDLGEEHGHRVLRVRGKGGKAVLVPLPPAVARAIDRAVDGRDAGDPA
jgi:integrase